MTHTGKIGRLPQDIREELNRRLQDGAPGLQLVAWLNGLPETRQVLAAEFGGRPINAPNLSAWRTGGYQEWLMQEEMREQVCEMASKGAIVGGGRLAEHVTTLLEARYVSAVTAWDGKPSEAFGKKLRLLRSLCRDVARLRQGSGKEQRADLRRKLGVLARLKTGTDQTELR